MYSRVVRCWIQKELLWYITGWSRDPRTHSRPEYRTGCVYPSTYYEPHRYTSVCQLH